MCWAATSGMNYSASSVIDAFFLLNGRYIDFGGDQTFRIHCGDNTINLDKFKFNNTDYTNSAIFYVTAW